MPVDRRFLTPPSWVLPKEEFDWVTFLRDLDTSITISKAAAADPDTDITAAELETLTDGSDADSLHTHGGAEKKSDVAFAEIYAKDNATNTTLNSSAKVQVTVFASNGDSSGMTPDHTNDHITVDLAGYYLCTVSISVENQAVQSHQITLDVYKNNGATAFSNLHGERNLSGGSGDRGSMSLSGIIDLALNDTIELWAETDSASDRDVTFEDITLSLVRIGDT